MPSLSMIALPLSSWPVTIRRIWWVGCIVVFILVMGSFGGRAGSRDRATPAGIFATDEFGHPLRRDRLSRLHRARVQQIGKLPRCLYGADLVGEQLDDRRGHVRRAREGDPSAPVEAGHGLGDRRHGW